jgi:toxin ParE1/3/4
MPTFRLTAKARADLRDIGCYTQEVWGREERNHYLSRLDEAFHLLAREPNMGRSCDDIRPAYRKYHQGRHVIFYPQSGEDIEIIRILHERMDIEACLSG